MIDSILERSVALLAVLAIGAALVAASTGCASSAPVSQTSECDTLEERGFMCSQSCGGFVVHSEPGSCAQVVPLGALYSDKQKTLTQVKEDQTCLDACLNAP
jgi:hypothetical protein